MVIRPIRLAVLYTTLALAANAAAAGTPPDLAAFATGGMRKLVPAAAPSEPVEAALIDETDAPRNLSEFRGKYVLLNFWATWCAPCRTEMPALDRLQAELGGERFQVVTVATGPNPVPAIERFFGEAGVTHLPKLRDPKQLFARSMGVLGLPITVVLDPDGREIARLTGDAEWDGPEAQAMVAALIAAGG